MYMNGSSLTSLPIFFTVTGRSKGKPRLHTQPQQHHPFLPSSFLRASASAFCGAIGNVPGHGKKRLVGRRQGRERLVARGALGFSASRRVVAV